MATSPLATSLLGEGNANALGLDPAALEANSDIQLGQGMQQGGLSTAPAYLPQALARLAQTLSGTYVKSQGLSELGKAMSGGIEGLKDVFSESTPIGKGLRSDNGLVRMMAAQQAPKAMLLNSEGYDLGPASQRFSGTQMVAENTRPRTGPGQTVEEALRLSQSGQPAAASALTRTISKEGSTPEGVPYPTVPLNPPRVAPVPPVRPARPPVSQTGAGASPSAAIEPPVTPDQRQAGINELAQQMKKPGASGVVNPTTTGMTPPPLTKGQIAAQTSPSMTDQIAAAKGKIESAEKGASDSMEQYTKVSTPAYNSANALKGRLDIIDHNIDQLGPRWMGAGADTKAELGKTLNSTLDTMGVKGLHIDPQKIATWEDFNKETKRAGMELIKSNFGGSREAASIIQMGASAVPSVQNTYLGAKYVSSTIRAAAQREIDLHEYKTNLIKQGQPILSADVDFNKTHPPQGYAMGAITSQIPQPAVQHLRSDPTLAPQFDKQFGPGTAEYLIGQK